MTLACLGRMGRLLGSAALLALGCAPARITDDGGAGTGSTSADDGGGSSSGGGSGTGSSSGGSSGTGGTGTGSGASNTGTTDPACGPIPLADTALGIGGFVLDGEARDDFSGLSVSGAGDVNGDGLADVIVGTSRALDWSGRAYVVFGRPDTQAMSLEDVVSGVGGFALHAEAEGDHCCGSVSGAGDVNGDGLDDVIVGASGADPNGEWSGRAYVVFGKGDTAQVSLADVAAGIGGFALDGEAEGDQSGSSVSGADDINGDGLADVIVVAPSADPNELEDSGRTYVVFGTADTQAISLEDVAQGTGGFVLDGEIEKYSSVVSSSGAGDVNGDGFADVLLGAPRAVNWAGRTYVVFGKADTAPVELGDVAQGVGGFVLDGEAWDDWSGDSVSGVGDVNGDGLDDVVVGASGVGPVEGDGTNGPDSGSLGRTYVVFGKADTDAILLADVTLGNGGFVLDGEAKYDHSGYSVSGAGDVNGDGLDDVIVGALDADPHGLQESGRTYVVFGKTGTAAVSLASVAKGLGGFALDGEAQGDRSGASVSGAGDVNGDGVPDVIVGAPRADPNDVNGAGRTYVVFGGDFSCEGG